MFKYYELQKVLNVEGFKMPLQEDEAVVQVLCAFKAETGEVLQAAKPLWAWWKKPGDTDLNREHLLDELADVAFFQLAYLHVLETQAPNINQLDLPALFHTAEQQAHASHQEMQREPDFIQDRRLYQRDSLLQLNDIPTAMGIQTPVRWLATSLTVLHQTVYLFGFTRFDFELAYLKKFLVNIDRADPEHHNEQLQQLRSDVKSELLKLNAEIEATRF